METYVMLTNLTGEGIQTYKQSPQRIDATKKMMKSMGAEMKEFYNVVGRYNFLVIFEAPDVDTALKLAIKQSSEGNVRSEILQLIPEDQYRALIASM